MGRSLRTETGEQESVALMMLGCSLPDSIWRKFAEFFGLPDLMRAHADTAEFSLDYTILLT